MANRYLAIVRAVVPVGDRCEWLSEWATFWVEEKDFHVINTLAFFELRRKGGATHKAIESKHMRVLALLPESSIAEDMRSNADSMSRTVEKTEFVPRSRLEEISLGLELARDAVRDVIINMIQGYIVLNCHAPTELHLSSAWTNMVLAGIDDLGPEPTYMGLKLKFNAPCFKLV